MLYVLCTSVLACYFVIFLAENRSSLPLHDSNALEITLTNCGQWRQSSLGQQESSHHACWDSSNFCLWSLMHANFFCPSVLGSGWSYSVAWIYEKKERSSTKYRDTSVGIIRLSFNLTLNREHKALYWKYQYKWILLLISECLVTLIKNNQLMKTIFSGIISIAH